MLDNLLGRIEGRVYYNLLNWYRTLALLPGFALNRRAMEEMMGVGAPLPDAIADRLAPPRPVGLARFAVQARLGLVGLRLAIEAVRLPGRVARFDRRLVAALAPPDPPLAVRPLTALAAEYRALEGRVGNDGRLWLLGRLAGRAGSHFPFAVEAAARTWPGVTGAALLPADGRALLVVSGDAAQAGL